MKNLLHHFRPTEKLKAKNEKGKRCLMFTLILMIFVIPSISFAQSPIELLEPIGTTTHITTGNNPFGALNQYLQPFMPLIIGSSAGLAVLMIILGGFQIMLSGGAIAQSAGKDRILAALLGLSLLVFSAVILYMLNSNFFVLI